MLKALQKDEKLSADRERLWKIGAGRSSKRENGQIDVVLSLWEEGILELTVGRLGERMLAHDR
jgi:hypothetical protein